MRQPAVLALFAWQAGWVFALRSTQLWIEPTRAAGALVEMAFEKQKAFADGMTAASLAAMRGADLQGIAAAALRPTRRRVSANAKALTKPRRPA